MARTMTITDNSLIGMSAPETHWDGRDAGASRKAHKRMFAATVTAAFLGIDVAATLPCVHCGDSFDWISMGDCDRIVPDKGYMIGNVIMICRACNETRGNIMQQNGLDFRGIGRYADDVILATRAVIADGCVSATEAVRWIAANDEGFSRRQRVGGHAHLANLARSPYWEA